MAKVKTAKPPGVFGVILTDLVFGTIWLIAAVTALQSSPIEAGINFVLVAGIVVVAILTFTRKSIPLLLSMAAHILLSLLFVFTGIFNLFFQPRPPGMVQTGTEVSEYAGVLIVIVIPAICAAHCWKLFQYNRQQEAAAARARGERPAAEEDDFETARDWDQGRKG